MVKLTDEICSALLTAQRKGLPIRIHVDEQGGKWELGDSSNGGQVFRYQQQALPGPPTDAVVHDPRTGTHRTIAAFRSKYQSGNSASPTMSFVQYSGGRGKSRGIKDVTKHRQKGNVFKTGTTRVGSASSSRNASPLLTRTLDSSSSRISPNKFANSTGSNNNSSQQNNGSSNVTRTTPTQHLNSELRKKKLRQRIIQLVVLGKFSGADLVLRQLRKDGLNEEADIERRVEDIVEEVSEPSGSGSSKITLKPSLYGEVDTRWLWYNQEEKAYVRRVTQGLSSSQTKSSTFAPLRKSGMERMQAPSHTSNTSSSTTGNTVSPEAIPTPPSSRPASAVPGLLHKTAKHANAVPNGCREQAPNVCRNPQQEVSSGSKRKAHIPAVTQQQANETKRPRQESASPPEDPTSHPQHSHKLVPRSDGSTASSRLSSPCSLSSPTQPSCDWDKSYGEIKTVHEAEKYFALFQQDYPEYLECYRILNEVAKEFRQLEMQLKNAVDNRKDFARVEHNIQVRFAHFDKDPEFIKTRLRYADLHSKLTVLKSRISDFERSQDMAVSASTTVPMNLCDLE
ncbi:hypothetical protein KIN20_003734 [Parelaphostrongylus tenuis]|uniref:OCEL domain-containing protein n=1 Tax=Parelaphostrongylus tenuis TaxID=148309 RepID=A0AAD5LXT3_PARTN|nr:hypothetical protein KIN20_003734 [Parelaphostrongylus tenuis]